MLVVNITPPKNMDVFALHGAEAEAQAYAMAKYSRSSLPLKQALSEISSQKAHEFLNTFYFQYGHKSIADLAHIPLGIENISLLAAIDVVDEQLWDGQERSTRYQDFSKREYYVPPDMTEIEAAHYHATMNMIFDAYEALFEEARAYFLQTHPRPEDMDEKAYHRTVNARAFDVARYMLPMGTLTSVGQITSARTLESQISRLLASPYQEVREVGEAMKRAVTVNAPYDVSGNERAGPVTPTLVKYAVADTYKEATRRVALLLLEQLEAYYPIRHRNTYVDCVVEGIVEIDMLAAILYEFTNRTMESIRTAIHKKTPDWRNLALTALLEVRGKHDALLRGYHSRGGLNFDIVMDLGGYRDLHRHRRVLHISQEYTTAHGFAMPDPLCTDKLAQIYTKATQQVEHAYTIMRNLRSVYGASPKIADYLLPLGTKHRFLMKMDVAEAAYIAELRTGPAGHISYRKVAWEIYGVVQEFSPALAASMIPRVSNPWEPVDFFKR